MKKLNKLLILITALIILGILYINSYIYLYTSPNTNTKVFPYLANLTKELNIAIDKASQQVNTYNFKTKTAYVEAYGSGFLKNNITSSDLDYAAGLYLGEFVYDGNNIQQITSDIIKITSLFDINFVDTIKTNFFPVYSNIISDSNLLNQLDNKNTILSDSLTKALTGKNYQIKIKDTIFEMSPYEAVLPDYKYLKLYTKNIKYNADYPELLREVTINMSYFADIKDKTTGKIKTIHISSETFNGHRFQKETRLFVPSAYTNINSFHAAKYFLKYSKANKELRMNNYFAHVRNSDGINGDTTSPIKAVKRTLQCAEILSPILPDETLKEIRQNSYEILSSKTMAYLNDYITAGLILKEIAKSEKLLNNLESTNKEVTTQITAMEQLLANMINDPEIKYEELKPLFNYQKMLNKAKNDLSILNEITNNNDTEKYIYKLMASKIKNRAKFSIYNKYFLEIMDVAGIHKIYLWKDKPNHVFILKDKITRNINPDEFNKLNMKNGYKTKIYDKNTKFDFTNKNNMPVSESEIYWLRYNPTPLQDNILKDIYTYFEKNNKQYRIRIKAGLMR